MIDKIIIAEDQEFANLSVQKTMEDLRIMHFDYAFYCDDALTKIQIANRNGRPYDLLITDLNFEDDGTSQKIGNGYELIRAVREHQPGIMILILSAESNPAIIDKLYKDFEVDAYVRKARHDVKELKAAFDALSKNQKYYPRSLAQLVKQSNTYEFTELDISIICMLSQGNHQKQIADTLKKSQSTIEKSLKKLRDEFGFLKNEQLVRHCMEKGIL